jgi:dipeptidyl-peptidase-4
MTIIL